MDASAAKEALRRFILSEFLPGEDPAALTDDVRLISDGVVDSLGSLKLVAFIEERFGVRIAAHEVDADHLDRLDDIARLIEERRR
jgi:acyl carrier protein